MFVYVSVYVYIILEETPLKSLKCEEIRVPKATTSGIDYRSFCERVEYVLSAVNVNEFNAATTFISSPDIEGENTQLTNYEPGIFLGMMKHHPVGLIYHGPGRQSADMLHGSLKCFPNVKYMLAVGVCYGFDRDMVKYGDVLISNQIEDLGPIRIANNKIVPHRGTVSIKDEIKSVFCKTPDLIEGLQVSSGRKAKHLVGKIVSSSILIDDPVLKKKITDSLTGKLLGGEMEGGELLQVQENGVTMTDGSTKKIQGIIIKAVVDYADSEKTKVWQFIAAQAAFHYVEGKLAQVSSK